ncbi:hypothetical protein J7394_21295 [Ruegeria sp. R13_0]|uniref:hypothetical protein n=1 Tax=Ruegeria sp. R13_0 TaxID=2821099 RepID=UPI001ADB5515|nr:hypothetical protein [Ruegeria sp. R13_0]MBO9436752.1 hypothetical protein [Ruegeria sp. R13_0]
MPNATAQLVFYLWPIVVFFLFRRLPVTHALICSIIAGYLLLPSRVGIDLPMVPTINKYSMPSVMAAIMCVVAVRTQVREALRKGMPAAPLIRAPQHKSLGVLIINILLFLMFVSPLLTMLTNREPIFAGPFLIRGLTFYDGLSMMGIQLFTIIPFLLARRFIASPKSHIVFLKILCVAGLCYSVLALFEVRMSPQLNVKIYGFFPHDFLQHMRAGGFRPVVFLHHGLWVGIFFAMAILAAAALTRCKDRISKRGLWRIATFWLLGVLFLCKSVGAFVIALALLPAALFLRARGQLVVASALAVIVLFYPMLRGAGWVPTEEIYNTALKFSEERAASLNFRLRHEDMLLDRANQKSLAGWGSWGRNLVYDPVSGESLSVTDGAWVIAIGAGGWLGYIVNFGLLTLPIIFLVFQHRKRRFGFETSGLALVMAANLVELIPNATLVPLTWMISGALMGRYAYQRQENPESTDLTFELGVQSLQPTTLRTRTRRGLLLDAPRKSAQTDTMTARKPRTN